MSKIVLNIVFLLLIGNLLKDIIVVLWEIIVICFLRKRFLFFILSTLLALTTQNSVYGQMENACIASDAVPSTRVIETDLGLNQITPGEVVEFRLSCKGELRLSINMLAATAALYSFPRKLREAYHPSDAFLEVRTNVTYLNNPSIVFRSVLDVFNHSRIDNGTSLNIPSLGAGKTHEFSVRIEVLPKRFFATVMPDPLVRPEPLVVAYLFSISEHVQSAADMKYAPYPVGFRPIFDAEKEPCIVKPPTVFVRDVVDFGVIDRADFQDPIQERFMFKIIRNEEDTCQSPPIPIVTFKSNETVINNEIYLDNGTILSLEDLKKYGKIKLNQPMDLGEMEADGSVGMFLNAELRRNPSKPLKTGEFSTVLIYNVEYR